MLIFESIPGRIPVDSDFLDEANKPFVRRQTEAVARALLLKQDRAPMTFNEVIGVLAAAEVRAVFRCGFVGLNGDTAYKEQLKEYMISQKLLALDANRCVSLTPEGRKLAGVLLPWQIEQNI